MSNASLAVLHIISFPIFADVDKTYNIDQINEKKNLKNKSYY